MKVSQGFLGVGLDLLSDGPTADGTLAEGLGALLAGDEVSAGDKDDARVSVHAHFALFFPLQLPDRKSVV